MIWIIRQRPTPYSMRSFTLQTCLSISMFRLISSIVSIVMVLRGVSINGLRQGHGPHWRIYLTTPYHVVANLPPSTTVSICRPNNIICVFGRVLLLCSIADTPLMVSAACPCSLSVSLMKLLSPGWGPILTISDHFVRYWLAIDRDGVSIHIGDA